MALQSSQRLPELLFYTKKSYRILQLQFQLQLQLQFYKGTHPSTYKLHMHNYTTVHPENSPSRIQFYMQKTKSSSSTTSYRGQRTFIPEKKFYAWKARRSSRNPSVFYRTFQTFQSFQSFQSFQTFQSFMTFQPFQAILQCSSISRESTPFQHSPIRMHILQILQFDWFPQKLHPVPVEQYKLQTLHSSKKGRCCDIGQIDIFSRIELIPSFVLSSDNTNYKNDIQ